MIHIQNEGIVLEKTGNDFENQAVLNPGCIRVEDETYMLYRAVRQGNFSSLGYCRLKGIEVVERSAVPVLFPEYGYEWHGLEDPRIVQIDGVFHILYTAYDGTNALVAHATTKDFRVFEKHGVISPEIPYREASTLMEMSEVSAGYSQCGERCREFFGESVMLWDKDAMLFPRKIDGKFAMIHRLLPGIQIVFFEDFSQLTTEFWMKHLRELSSDILLDPKYWYESKNIGGGCPPIETEAGWLFIYHAVEKTAGGNVYRASAALFDRADPRKVIARLAEPLFSPEEEWERNGDVDDVVFPTGALVEGIDLIVFYGAADSRIAVKRINMESLLSELRNSPVSSS